MTVEVDHARFCTFFLGNDCYGIDILAVREVNRNVSMTPVRGARPSIRGLMNLRGQIVTVIDPAICLGAKAVEIGRSTRLVVLKPDNTLEGAAASDAWVGLLVDRISDVISAKSDEIDAAPPQRGAYDGLIGGVIRLKEDVVRLIDSTAMLLLVEKGA